MEALRQKSESRSMHSVGWGFEQLVKVLDVAEKKMVQAVIDAGDEIKKAQNK